VKGGIVSRLDEIKARRAAATPGPWNEAGMHRSPGRPDVVWDRDGRRPIARATWLRDAEFIAHAPDDIDWLIGEVTRLSARVKNLLGEQAAGIKLMHERDRLAAELAWTQAGIARISEAWTEAVQREQRTANAHAYDLQQVRAERDVAKAALESGDACGAVGCRAVVERDRLAAQVRAVEALCAMAVPCMVDCCDEHPTVTVGLIRAALASAVTPEPTERRSPKARRERAGFPLNVPPPDPRLAAHSCCGDAHFGDGCDPSADTQETGKGEPS
jgi:hypothetical protein